MRRYAYEAARADGEVVRGVVEAATATDALQGVTARGLLVVGVRECPTPRLRTRSPRALAVFFRSLATLLKAGIPLDRALQTGESNPMLRALVRDVRARVREGASLSSALSAQGGIPRLAVGLVRAGEGAKLDGALEEAARQLEREADLRARLAAALTYPLVLVLAGSGVVAVLVFSVLPRFVALLGDAGSALPASTRVLLGVAHIAQRQWAVLAVVLVLAAVVAVRWLRSTEGHEVLLAVPGIGSLRFALATARVTRALSPLLATGAPALGALHAAAEAAGDRAIAARVGRAAERVGAGASIGAALAAERAVQSQAVELVRAGEQAGRLPELLRHAADDAEAEATRRLHAAVQLVEPLLILAFGAIVGFVALALLQAVYGLRIR